MNDIYIGDNNNLLKPMVDFNYKMRDSKSSRRSMFDILSPKKNPKTINKNNNPKEIFNANNKVNLILSKYLKSIYKENENDISSDNPLYKNLNCLIKKNYDNNKYIYDQMVNFGNNKIKRKQFKHRETNYLCVNTISEQAFQNSEISSSRSKKSRPSAFSVSPFKNTDLKKEFESAPMNKPKRKSEFKVAAKNKGTKSAKNFELENLRDLDKKHSLCNNFKFGLKTNKKIFGTNATVGSNNDELKKIVRDNSDKTKIHNPNFFHPELSFTDSQNSNVNSTGIINKIPIGQSTISAYLNPQRFSVRKINHNFKINSGLSTKSKSKKSRRSDYVKSPCEVFLKKKMKSVRKELTDLENSDLSEILNNLPRKKSVKTKSHRLSNALNTMTDRNNIIELKEMTTTSLKSTSLSNNKSESHFISEDDKFERKYRKLFLNKNLYDSLDDEEIMDQERRYHFLISTNSITVYILDALILIASLIELYYLPIYISLYISSFAIYHNIISSVIFYIIDFIYIIDLISGFFRAYYDFDETLVKRNTLICLNYLTGWFIFDLLEAIPFFTVLDNNMNKLGINFMASNKNFNNMYDFGLNNRYFGFTILKLMKFFKILSNNIVLNAFNKFIDKSQFLSEWKGLFQTILIGFSVLHFSSCFFIFIGRNEAPGWIITNNLQDSNFIEIYITALYCQMTTLTTVGYGDISATNGFEKIYGIFMLIVGTCAYSWILTYISNYIKKNNEKFIDFEEKMKVLKEIKLEYPNIGKNLYDRISRYLNYNKSIGRCNLKFILESLPSSLQNNLIIEIYKPIIRNFQFFKSFENSDFFVKIVTSLKPILSMKDDILVQEGDIIEDIIFIKNGVLTLEIIIDLSNPTKSVESHLKQTTMKCYKNISDANFTALMKLSTLDSKYKSELHKQIYDEKYKKKKEIKIIDLRKNEHFGDILMILNEKSPLTVKVKSKKAELFFLEKTEAVEISNRYPNIWKRIVNKSLHNMKQIKRLIKKKVFLFIEMYNIEIDQQLKEKYLKYEKASYDSLISNLNQKNKTIVSSVIETIIEEDESIKSITHRTEKKTDRYTNVQQPITDKENTKFHKSKSRKVRFMEDIKIGDNNMEKDNRYIKQKTVGINNKQIKEKTEIKNKFLNSTKTVSFKEVKNNLEINKNISSMNDMINIIDQEVKKSSQNNHINTVNINIYTPKVHIPINQIKIENHNANNNIKEEKEENEENEEKVEKDEKIENVEKEEKVEKVEKEEIINSSNSDKINSEISCNSDFMKEMKSNDILMDNYDENCHIFLLNKKSTEKEENKNIKAKKDLNIKKIFEERKFEKIINKNIKSEKGENKTNDKASIKSISSDKSKTDIEKKNDLTVGIKKQFTILNSSLSTSFTINSSYENINEISKFKYHKSPDLREKTKKFILAQLNKDNERPNYSNIDKNNNNYINIKSMKINKKKIIRKHTESIKSNRNPFHDTISIDLPGSKKLLEDGIDNKMITQLKFSKSTKKKVEILHTNGDETPKRNNINSQSNVKKLKNKFKRNSSAKEGEINFYHKINGLKSYKKKNLDNKEENNEIYIKKTGLNYDKIISKNIEKNQKNLNNPEEYYERFFNDIICKKKDDDFKKIKTFQFKIQ